MSCLLGLVSCLCCDILGRQCNCLIFPSPECSYSIKDNQSSQSLSRKYKIFSNNNKEIPYLQISTANSRKYKKCCIYFHGNAEDIGLVHTFLEPIAQTADITIYAIEYPTYGHYQKLFPCFISNNIKQDSLSFYDYLIHQNQGRTHKDIVVIGRSIGSGGASYLAGNRQVPALILISPFDTITEVAKGMVGCLGCIVKQHFDNLQQLRKFDGKLLVIHGEQDEVIKVEHGKNLVRVYETQSSYKNKAIAKYPTYMSHNRFDLTRDIVNPTVNFLKEMNFLKQ